MNTQFDTNPFAVKWKKKLDGIAVERAFEEHVCEEYEGGRCVSCGDVYIPLDFTGATEGDR